MNDQTATAGGQAALAEALGKAVPAWIATLAGMPKLAIAVMRSQVDAALAEADLADPYHADPDGNASWATDEAFNALAKQLALDAYRPGGVTYLGMHWKATRPPSPGPADTVTIQSGAL